MKLFTSFLISFVFFIHNVNCQRVAVAHLNRDLLSGITGQPVISGAVQFLETDEGVRVTGAITGLEPGEYGFHVHELGDTSTCVAAGAHFNPEGRNHGGREHDVRHVGDLGNVVFTPPIDGAPALAAFDFVDPLLSLRGRNNILGRTLVLHEQPDDLGLGNHQDSLTTGNAGGRVACAVIGISGNVEYWNAASSISISSVLLFLSFSFWLIIFK